MNQKTILICINLWIIYFKSVLSIYIIEQKQSQNPLGMNILKNRRQNSGTSPASKSSNHVTEMPPPVAPVTPVTPVTPVAPVKEIVKKADKSDLTGLY